MRPNRYQYQYDALDAAQGLVVGLVGGVLLWVLVIGLFVF